MRRSTRLIPIALTAALSVGLAGCGDDAAPTTTEEEMTEEMDDEMDDEMDEEMDDEDMSGDEG